MFYFWILDFTMDIPEPIQYNPNPNDIWLLWIYPDRSETKVLYLNPICTCKFTRMRSRECYKIEPKSEKPDPNPNAQESFRLRL